MAASGSGGTVKRLTRCPPKAPKGWKPRNYTNSIIWGALFPQRTWLLSNAIFINYFFIFYLVQSLSCLFGDYIWNSLQHSDPAQSQRKDGHSHCQHGNPTPVIIISHVFLSCTKFAIVFYTLVILLDSYRVELFYKWSWILKLSAYVFYYVKAVKKLLTSYTLFCNCCHCANKSILVLTHRPLHNVKWNYLIDCSLCFSLNVSLSGSGDKNFLLIRTMSLGPRLSHAEIFLSFPSMFPQQSLRQFMLFQRPRDRIITHLPGTSLTKLITFFIKN